MTLRQRAIVIAIATSTAVGGWLAHRPAVVVSHPVVIKVGATKLPTARNIPGAEPVGDDLSTRRRTK